MEHTLRDLSDGGMNGGNGFVEEGLLDAHVIKKRENL